MLLNSISYIVCKFQKYWMKKKTQNLATAAQLLNVLWRRFKNPWKYVMRNLCQYVQAVASTYSRFLRFQWLKLDECHPRSKEHWLVGAQWCQNVVLKLWSLWRHTQITCHLLVKLFIILAFLEHANWPPRWINKLSNEKEIGISHAI